MPLPPAVIAFDTETHLIEPGKLAPPLVCVQWRAPAGVPAMLHRDDPRTRKLFELWWEFHDTLVGHNVAFDMGVLGAQWPAGALARKSRATSDHSSMSACWSKAL